MQSGAPDVRLRLTLEYDGTPFRGWAAQPGLPTVEGALREALAETFGSFANLAVAGRTDTGVHALGQVASVDVEGGPPPERAAEALNTRLPDEISVLAAEPAAPDFHARHSARSRSYRYRIFNRRTPSPFEVRRSWWVVAAARRGAARRRGGAAGGRARLPCVHADRDAARRVPARRRARRVDPPRRPSRLRDHRRQLPPPHGAEPRRHDARARPRRDRRRCSAAVTAARPG